MAIALLLTQKLLTQDSIVLPLLVRGKEYGLEPAEPLVDEDQANDDDENDDSANDQCDGGHWDAAVDMLELTPGPPVALLTSAHRL